MMTAVVARVSRLAAGQWGLLTTAQAARDGITRLQLARLADAGVLERLGRGVYAATSSADEHLSLRAAWLALDPARTAEERLKTPTATGVVSHASAAGLHNLGDLLNDEHEFTLPQRKQTRREGVRVHRGDLTGQDVTIVEGLPVTTEERTIADLLRAGSDPEHIAQIIGQGVRRGVVDLANLAVRLDPLARRHNQPDGGALVEYLLDIVGLSRAAMARGLAQSPAGQDLVAAGRLSVFAEMFRTVLPTTGTSRLHELAESDLGRFAGLHDVGIDIEQGSPAFAPIQEAGMVSPSPSMLAMLAAMQSPGAQPAITAARSTTKGEEVEG